MDAKNLINRLVAQKLQAGSGRAFCQPQNNAKAICVNRAFCGYQSANRAVCGWAKK